MTAPQMTNRPSVNCLSAMHKTLGAIIFCLLGNPAWASEQPVAVVTHVSGTLTKKRPDETIKLLSVKSEVMQGDTLVTEAETYARLKFIDGSEVVLRPQSRVKVDKFSFEEIAPAKDSMVLSLLKGGMRAVTGLLGRRSKENVEYKTPTATIGIRGTNTGMLHCDNDCGNIPTTSGRPPANGTHVDVAFGSVIVRNESGSQIFNAGQFGFVPSADSPPIMVPPNQGIQITIPPSINTNSTGGRSLGGSALDTQCTP